MRGGAGFVGATEVTISLPSLKHFDPRKWVDEIDLANMRGKEGGRS